jgi:hypothetical protein
VSVQRIHLLTLTACAAIAAAALALREEPPHPEPARPSALSAVPSGASFVLTLDLAQLRDSELGRALLSAGRELPGVGRIDAICGFDPAEDVREVAVAMPPFSTGDELGVVIAGDVRMEQISECVERVVRRRGGKPSRTQLGSFVAIRDRSAPAGAEVLVRDGGPVLLGQGHYLRDMVDAAQGRTESSRQDPAHASLRRRIGQTGPLTASWSLDAGWLERVSGDELARLSPLSELRAAAVRMDIAPEVAVRALLVCTSADACQRVAQVLRSFSRDLGPALREELGDDPLAGARIDLSGATLELSLQVPSERLSAMARRLMARWAAAPAASPTGTPRSPPDQIVRP